MKPGFARLRSHMLKACFPLAILALHNYAQAQRLSGKQEKYFQQEILKYINGYRADKGLAALVLDENLSRISYAHSLDMSVGNVAFGHGGFRDRMVKARLSNSKMSGFAENVAYGMQSPQEVSQEWYASPGHKKNMLGTYLLTGIGVERGDGGYLYFTQVFER